MASNIDNTDSPNGYWPLDRSAFEIRRRMLYPSNRQTINEAVDLILEVARECGCDTEQEADLEIALREALANASRRAISRSASCSVSQPHWRATSRINSTASLIVARVLG